MSKASCFHKYQTCACIRICLFYICIQIQILSSMFIVYVYDLSFCMCQLHFHLHLSICMIGWKWIRCVLQPSKWLSVHLYFCIFSLYLPSIIFAFVFAFQLAWQHGIRCSISLQNGCAVFRSTLHGFVFGFNWIFSLYSWTLLLVFSLENLPFNKELG